MSTCSYTHSENVGNRYFPGYGKYIEYRGESHTIKDWAKITGIKLKTLYERLAEWGDIERALTEPIHKTNGKRVTLPDGTTLSVSKLAKKLNVPTTTIYSQIMRGWPVERILAQTEDEREPDVITGWSYRTSKDRELQEKYRHLVKLVGNLRRDGNPPSVAWFADLDACLDDIWDIEATLNG